MIGQLRSTQRYKLVINLSKEKLHQRVIELATQYGRYGYCTIADLLVCEGFEVGKGVVYTIWREEGLKVPQKQPKRARLYLADGSFIRLRAEHRNHVWSYDFVHDRTHDGTSFRILNVINEHTRECLVTYMARRIRSRGVILVLCELFLKHGVPRHPRSDNGPEFVAKKLVAWLAKLEVRGSIRKHTIGRDWLKIRVVSFIGNFENFATKFFKKLNT